MTINSFFRKSLNPTEAKEFIKSIADQSISNPRTFEEQALRYVGKDLYEAFFKGYTEKQWGFHPSELPATILKRLPVRFNYDDNYYSSKYQGIPKNGYTYIVERMLDQKNIEVRLNAKVQRDDVSEYDHVFYSGPIDEWFNHAEGRLGYRTLDFVTERHENDFQGNAVINYGEKEIPWTRISEHKHFAPWEEHEKTIIYKEHSRMMEENDIPYYPIRLVNDKSLLQRYIELANKERNITFAGRLGTYRYLDMHITIEEALQVSEAFVSSQCNGTSMPVFNVNPA